MTELRYNRHLAAAASINTHLHTCVSKHFSRIMGACAVAGSLFQIVDAAMLKALAPHAVRVLGTYSSGLDDEHNETVELITANCLTLIC